MTSKARVNHQPTPPHSVDDVTHDGVSPAHPALKVERLPIDSVIPYWRNPRRIPDEAVNAVARSLTEFGYQQPVVVDAQNVIVIGHTRYAAMRRLHVTHLDVIRADDLPPDKVRALRLIDNRAAEYTGWDFEALAEELRGTDLALMAAFFPEVGELVDDPSSLWPDSGPIPGADTTDQPGDADTSPSADFVCPSCFHSWTMEIDPAQVQEGLLIAPSPSPVGAIQ